MLHLFDGAAWVNIGPSVGAGSGGAAVGTTPPSNPAIGALWWNGTVLSVWDGTQWAAAQTTTQVFGIVVSSALSFSATAWVQTPFTTSPSIDIQTGWSAGSHQYTPKVAGTYAVFTRGVFNLTGASNAGVAVLKNDPGSFTGTASDTVVAISSRYDANGISDWLAGGGYVTMNGTTDYIRMYVRSTAGTLQSTGINYALGVWKLP